MAGAVMASQPRTCAECETALHRKNKSGLCRVHASARAMQSPEMRAKVSLGRRRRFQADPEFRAREAERLRTVRTMRVGVGDNLIQGRLWELGNAARPAGSPSRMQAGAKTRARRAINAGCPPHLVEEYYFLTRKKHLPTAEAIAAVQAQEATDMQRWRRSVGAPVPDASQLKSPEQGGQARDAKLSADLPGEMGTIQRHCGQPPLADLSGSPTFSMRSA